jgi:CBS domain-containing protein
MLKQPIRILITALFVAWAFDFLFWHKSPGVSFAVYVAVLLIAGFLLARSEGTLPARNSLWLLIPLFLFAIMTTIRLEPMTVFVSVLITLMVLMIFSHTFRGGRWISYSLSDIIMAAFRLLKSAFTGAPKIYQQVNHDREDDPYAAQAFSLKSLLPIIRGLLIALPVVIIFAALLSSADPIFSNQIGRLLKYFNLKVLSEFLFRGIYVLILAYALMGIYLYALSASKDENLIGMEKPWLRPFLGFTEAAIILGSVNLLFIVFVVIQFQYFFGGSANISYEGFTYAEYARRGFGELVVVAFLSLLLFLGLSSVTQRETSLIRKVYSGLGVLLGLLIGIILVSAFQRLLLYESAFGYTRLRIYPHIFMVWMGILLVAFVGLEIAGYQRAFGLVLLAACAGFGLTLGLLNVDGLIARENVERAVNGKKLDTEYLLTLSVDSTPVLVDQYESPDLSQELRDEVGVVLSCQAAELRLEAATQTWTGFHFSKWRAGRMLENMEEALQDYPVIISDDGLVVTSNGQEYSCDGRWWLD